MRLLPYRGAWRSNPSKFWLRDRLFGRSTNWRYRLASDQMRTTCHSKRTSAAGRQRLVKAIDSFGFGQYLKSNYGVLEGIQNPIFSSKSWASYDGPREFHDKTFIHSHMLTDQYHTQYSLTQACENQPLPIHSLHRWDHRGGANSERLKKNLSQPRGFFPKEIQD